MKKTSLIIITFSFLTLFWGVRILDVQAQGEMSENDVRSAFRSVYSIPTLSLVVPTVVEVPVVLENGTNRDVTVFSLDANNAMIREGARLYSQADKKNISYEVKRGGMSLSSLSDGRFEGYEEFDAKDNGEISEVEIRVEFSQPVSVSTFQLYLGSYVALPETAKIRAIVNGEEKILLSEKKVQSKTLSFPPTNAQVFIITMKHVQPLRLTEIEPGIENIKTTRKDTVRFLAQPNREYFVYVDADRSVAPFEREMPLLDGKDVLFFSEIKPKISNTLYVKSDIDKDGIEDEKDNCVYVSNTDQMDINTNFLGDACEDFDRDGVMNSVDNCRDTTNRIQLDSDNDGIGDECDTREDRFFERYTWILPISIVCVAGVLIVLILGVLRREKKI